MFPVLSGTGVLPTGAAASEINAITRRGFLPYLVNQFRQARPTICALIDNAVPVSGGLAPITQPVQVGAMTTAQTVGYDGSYNQPADQYNIIPAQFALKGIVVPVGFLGMEAAIQMDHTIVNRLKAKMTDASDTAVDFLSTALFSNTTDNSNIIGLPGAVDDGTNLATYGGINRTSYPVWNSYVRALSGTPTPTRQLMLNHIVNVSNSAKGEMPAFGVCDPGTWNLLAQDYQSSERFLVDKGGSYGDTEARSGFVALTVANVPIYFDASLPAGTIYFLNPKYISFHIHTGAFFAFSGWEPMTIINQIGYQGVFLTLLELVCNKPSTQGRVSGFNFAT